VIHYRALGIQILVFLRPGNARKPGLHGARPSNISAVITRAAGSVAHRAGTLKAPRGKGRWKMSNQNQEMEMGGLALHDVEYGRLAKAARAASRLGAPEATLMVSSSGARLFAADGLVSPRWWLDAIFGQPFATAGRALIAPPQKVAEALQRAVGESAGDVFISLEGGAVRFAGPGRTVTVRGRVAPFGAGERRIPINENMWFDVSTDRVVAAASLPYTLLAVAMDAAAPRVMSNVQLRLGRRPGPRGEWVLEVAGDALLHRVPVVVGVRPERVPVVGRYPAAVLGKLMLISIDELLTLEFTEPADAPALRARWVDSEWSIEFRVAPAPE